MATTSPKKREQDPWRRPDRRRVRALRERLREMYGVPVSKPNRKPIDVLVLTILSQHTNDRNSGRAFKLLRERFPTWDEVRDAPVREVEDAIRPGGLAQQKAPRIQAILRELGPEPSLDWTEDAPIEESREYLLSLPGVGRKTAACVLIFNCRRSRSTSTSTGSVGGSGSSRRTPRSSAPTTRCWPSCRPRTPMSCTST
jgi:endonuclease III